MSHKAVRLLIILMMVLSLVPPPAAAATFEVNEAWVKALGSWVTVADIDPTGAYAVASTQDGKIHVYTTAGVPVWNRTIDPSGIWDFKITGNNTIAAVSDNTVYFLDLTTGHPIFTYTNVTDTYFFRADAVSDYPTGSDALYVILGDYLHIVNGSGFELGGFASPGSGAGGDWYDMALDGSDKVVYALDDFGNVVSYGFGGTTMAGSTWYGNLTYLDITESNAGGGHPPSSSLTSVQVNITFANRSFFPLGDLGKRLEVYDTFTGGVLSNPLNFYIDPYQYNSANGQITLWVKMTLTEGGSNRIFLFSNVSRTTSLSCGRNTFQIFDDFEPRGTQTGLNSSQWNVSLTARATVLNGQLSMKSLAAEYPNVQSSAGTGSSAVADNVTLWSNVSITNIYPMELWFGFTNATVGSYNTVAANTSGIFLMNYSGAYKWPNMRSGWSGAVVEKPMPPVVWTANTWYQSWIHVNRSLIIVNQTNSVGQKVQGNQSATFSNSLPTTMNVTIELQPNTANVSVESLFVYHEDTKIRITPGTPSSLGVLAEPADDTDYWHVLGTAAYSGYFMTLDPSGGWLAISEVADHDKVGVSAGTFTGTHYTTATAHGAPTCRPAISSGGAFSTEGRGSGEVEIYRLDGTLDGTYTAGGSINAVAITTEGLWSVAGSDDMNLYVFQKAAGSSWALEDIKTPGAGLVTAVQIRSLGGTRGILAGVSDGTLVYYLVAEETAGFSQLLHFTKDGSPAVGYSVKVEAGGTTGVTWTTLIAGSPTDSNGNLVFQATSGTYYRVTVDGQVSTIQASSTYPTLYLSWTSPPAYPEYGSGFNVTNGTVDTFYRDPLTVPITVEIKNTDTRALAFCQTFTTDDLAISWSPPAGNHHYQVRITADRPTGATGGVYYATTGTGTTMELTPVQGPALQILLMIFLMVVAGLFGYVHAPVGGLAVSMIALWFNYMNWLTIPWYWVQLVVLVAFLGMIARGVDV